MTWNELQLLLQFFLYIWCHLSITWLNNCMLFTVNHSLIPFSLDQITSSWQALSHCNIFFIFVVVVFDCIWKTLLNVTNIEFHSECVCALFCFIKHMINLWNFARSQKRRVILDVIIKTYAIHKHKRPHKMVTSAFHFNGYESSGFISGSRRD